MAKKRHGDLYCESEQFLFLAQKAKFVRGVEIVPQQSKMQRETHRSIIENVEFLLESSRGSSAGREYEKNGVYADVSQLIHHVKAAVMRCC